MTDTATRLSAVNFANHSEPGMVPAGTAAALTTPHQPLSQRERGTPTGRANPLIMFSSVAGDFVAVAQLSLDLD